MRRMARYLLGACSSTLRRNPLRWQFGKNMLGQSDEPTIENNDAAVASANAQITALADLIRNPQPNRTMDDVTGQEDGTP